MIRPRALMRLLCAQLHKQRQCFRDGREEEALAFSEKICATRIKLAESEAEWDFKLLRTALSLQAEILEIMENEKKLLSREHFELSANREISRFLARH